MGMIHPFELAEEEGVELDQVAAAFVAAENLFDLPDLWASIDATAMPESARLMLFDRIAAAAGNLISDVLRTSSGHVDPSALVGDIGKAVAKLAGATTELLSTESRQQSDRLCDQLIAAGAPEALAARVAHLYDLDGAVGLAKLASEMGIAPIGLTEAFTDIGRRLGLDWAQSTAALMSPSDVWERLLVSGLARDFQQMRLELLRRLARRKDAKQDMPAAVAKWAEEQAVAVRGFRSMVARAQGQSPVAPAMLAQVASMARNLLGR
jgi:glutamate dehydrogenase